MRSSPYRSCADTPWPWKQVRRAQRTRLTVLPCLAAGELGVAAMWIYYSAIDFTLQNGYDTRSSDIFHPSHFYGDRPMRYATTALVSTLTGLSTTQLREWTNRRALVPADVPPAGKGSSAKFTWQTVLITLSSRRIAAFFPNSAVHYAKLPLSDCGTKS
jgi:hypothetical protein